MFTVQLSAPTTVDPLQVASGLPCSPAHVGAGQKAAAIATAISPGLDLPTDRDRLGLAGSQASIALPHPGLTEPADAAESAEINDRSFAASPGAGRTTTTHTAGDPRL